ncbi:hypothetical protein BJ165DRAFT_1482385 [Panaeolus papilionaceus]|nr:hypothetical protein BJ165DRAFT_1482385 [Panaeolus papilionaceus]
MYLLNSSFLYSCRVFVWWHFTFGGPPFISIVVNLILLMRIYALYEHSRRVLIFLVSLLLVQISCHIAVIVTILPAVRSGELIAAPSMQYLGCPIMIPGMRSTLLAWIPGMMVAVILFGMMIIRCPLITLWRKRKPTDIVSPLYKVFCFGGSYSFLTIIASTIVATTLSLTIPESPFVAASKPWMVAILSISGSRLILHLREIVNDAISTTVVDLGTMRFADANPDQFITTYIIGLGSTF